MARLELLCVGVTCIYYYLAYSIGGSEACEGLGNICKGPECDKEPEGCKYGSVKDLCRKRVCKKGPDQRCGGPSDIMGTCGDGMLCNCERCTGCSVDTLQCSDDKFLCIPEQTRPYDYFDD